MIYILNLLTTPLRGGLAGAAGKGRLSQSGRISEFFPLQNKYKQNVGQLSKDRIVNTRTISGHCQLPFVHVPTLLIDK